MNMTLEDFQKTLRDTGKYATPAEARRAPLPPFFAMPAFSMRMLGIMFSGFAAARRGGYSGRPFALSSFNSLRSVELTGGRVEIEGFENCAALDPSRGAVAVCNHASALETYLLPCALSAWKPATFVMKESLASYPLFGPIVRAIDPVYVTRKSPLDDLRCVLKNGVDVINGNRFVVLFPQGTRSRLFDRASFNTIGTKLALRAGAYVLPMCVSTDFLRIGKLQHDLFASCHPKSVVRIACGAPLPPDLKPAEMQERQIEFIESTLARWQALDSRPMLAAPASGRSEAE